MRRKSVPRAQGAASYNRCGIKGLPLHGEAAQDQGAAAAPAGARESLAP